MAIEPDGNGLAEAPDAANGQGASVWERAATGLRNYWYPVCGSRDVKTRWPSRFTRLGYEIAIVRRNGKPYAFLDECPHRGYTLSDGKYEFPGSDTITCRLHGMTFDLADRGNCVAVLTDGPDSPAVGKFRLRTFPTEERKGVVWVWFGRGAPAPLEEDVPGVVLEDDTLVKFRFRTVAGNWRNHATQDAGHFPTLHRDAIGLLFSQIQGYAVAREPDYVRDPYDGAVWLIQRNSSHQPIMQAEYPGLGVWPPKRLWRKMPRGGGTVPLKGVDARGGSFRLPGILRVINFPFKAGLLYEWYVAEDADHYTYFQLTCHFPRNPLSWLYTQAWYYLWGRPMRKIRFNNQDRKPVAAQWRYWKRHGANPPSRLYRPDEFNLAIIEHVNRNARGEGSDWQAAEAERRAALAPEEMPSIAGGSGDEPQA